jgi:hypothetical protein
VCENKDWLGLTLDMFKPRLGWALKSPMTNPTARTHPKADTEPKNKTKKRPKPAPRHHVFLPIGLGSVWASMPRCKKTKPKPGPEN